MNDKNNDNQTFPWVKSLGQWHTHKLGDHLTKCGAPMLGTNHARRIPESDREKCPVCFAPSLDKF